MQNPNSRKAKVKYGLKLVFALLWATPWILIATALMITIVGAPIAIVFWAIGALPYKHIVEKRARQRYEWKVRGRPMDNDEEVPWET